MIEHRCGIRGTAWLVALSAAFVGCSPHSYELGKDGTGASGEGGDLLGESGGKGGTGKGGTGNKGGTGGSGAALGGSSGTASAKGGGKTGGSGGTASAVGGSGATDVGGASPLMQIGNSPTKLDLLFMIDNSIGMAQKQAELAAAIPGLIVGLSACVDADDNPIGQFGTGGCPPGSHSRLGSLADIHIGIITSSLGDHGSGDVCSDQQNELNVSRGGLASNYNDLAMLLPGVRDTDFANAEDGFLRWDPASTDAGHADLGLLARDTASQVIAANERGCGYEAQLESWFRFLVDPEPVATVDHTADTAETLRGDTNIIVLAQRQAFLRPDSVLAIVMLTDENDCSILDENGTQGWLVPYKGGTEPNAPLWHMPRATSICETDPSSPCCQWCGNGGNPKRPASCPNPDDDPACQDSVILPLNEDSMNMRCFHQQQRFGIDLLYPYQRYVEALTATQIRPRLGGPLVQNPLFAPGPDGTPGRSGNQIVFAGIVGVPWQDIATPESLSGPALAFMSADELAREGRWDVILGDPEKGVPPTDPLMIESIDPRPVGAAHPLLDAPIAADTATANENPINGHEQTALAIRDDLQFACIYELPSPVPCTDENADGCECNADEFARNSPLCEGTTATTNGTQVYGKAYPSVRELQVLKGAGSNGVVASACTKQPSVAPYDDPNEGYLPAMRALATAITERFAVPCLPRSLPIDQCVVIEARPAGGGDCETAGRVTPDGYGADVAARVQSQLSALGYDAQGYAICQLPELKGDALDSCLNTVVNAADGFSDGYCYIDADQGIGNADVLASCPAAMKHAVRIFGEKLDNAMTFVSCADGR